MNLYRVLTLTLESGVGLSGIKAWSSLHVKFDLLFYEKITVYQRNERNTFCRGLNSVHFSTELKNPLTSKEN